MKATEILRFWKLHGLDLAKHEGFRLGSPSVELTGVLVCWLPTLDAILAAREQGCNLIIARDQYIFPPDYSGALVDHQLSDKVTQPRVRALVQAGITVFRAHSSLDGLLLDSLADALGLPQPELAGGLETRHEAALATQDTALHRIYHIEPVPVGELAFGAASRLGQPTVRLCGDSDRQVSRVALLWGNRCAAHNPDGLLPILELRPDVLIVGETDEYPMRAALDLDVPLIEIGHERSLAPGLQRFTQMLANQFPGLRVAYYENQRPWTLV